MGLFDEMLDVMEGGPKLRKWYGQDSSVGDPDAERAAYDGGDDDAEVPQVAVVDREEELRAWDKQPRRTTLVTGADTQLGEAVIMQLIVAKQPVTALGITPEVAESRYGPYVTGEALERGEGQGENSRGKEDESGRVLSFHARYHCWFLFPFTSTAVRVPARAMRSSHPSASSAAVTRGRVRQGVK